MLSEHDEFRWMKPDELPTLDLTAADVPVAISMPQSTSLKVIDEPETQEAVLTEEAGEELARMMGRISSVEEITMVAHSAVSNQSLLSQLVTLSSSTEKRVGFMSSWALSKVSDMDPAALSPYLAGMIDALPGVPNESVQRSFMRVIMRSRLDDIPLSHHARLIDYCMAIMRKEDTPVAPKAYGMEILSSFCSLYPEMVNEVAGLVQLAIADASGRNEGGWEKGYCKVEDRK